jgi:hypothetical protein
MSQKSKKMKRIVGPKPSNRFCHHGAPVSSGFAFTITLWSSSRFDSASVLANAGTSVAKSVVGFDPAYDCFCVYVPWIAVPFEVIVLT